MKKIHFKLGILCLILSIQGCATNDVNSPLVRFWNDGFVYTKKESDANQDCSREANKVYPNLRPGNVLWEEIYSNCMKKKGY